MPTLAAILVLFVLTSCGLVAGEPTPSSCDGIAAELGGCDPDRPTFSGETCSAVGDELGRQLSERAIRIFDGPQSVDGNDRTAQLTHVMVRHILLANKHLRDTGQAVECDVPEFTEAAVAAFSPEFKERVGANAFHDQTVSFEEWLEDFKRFLIIIDEDEEAPYAPASSSTPDPAGA